jgi:hypothetical protein
VADCLASQWDLLARTERVCLAKDSGEIEARAPASGFTKRRAARLNKLSMHSELEGK